MNAAELWEKLYDTELRIGLPVKVDYPDRRNDHYVVTSLKMTAGDRMGKVEVGIGFTIDEEESGEWPLDEINLDREAIRVNPSFNLDLYKNYRLGERVMTFSEQDRDNYPEPMFITGVQARNGALDITVGETFTEQGMDGFIASMESSDLDLVNPLLEGLSVKHWLSGQAVVLDDDTISSTQYWAVHNNGALLRSSLDDEHNESHAGLMRRADELLITPSPR